MADPLIVDSRHPMYLLQDYIKFNLTYAGGRPFIDTYLEKYSSREDKDDFERRKKLTHNPSYAAQALDEILAGITQRMPEIIRTGVTESYIRAVDGFDGGVDLQNSSMNSFMGTKILPKLTSIGRVGVYVDNPAFNPISTIAEYAVAPHPYLYAYDYCDILNWQYSYDLQLNEMLLHAVLLRERRWILNDAGLPDRQEEVFRLCRRVEGGVQVQFLRKVTDGKSPQREEVIQEFFLKLKRIPFVMYDIGKSLLTDAADIQIGLLNLASADLSYAINSNFPFYVEGYDPNTQNIHGKEGVQTTFDENGEPVEKTKADSSATPEKFAGVMHGRRYPYMAPPPQFIHPSPDPLRASMEKQEAMKQDIRRLLNLNVSNVAPSKASAESKKVDQSRGLESGLSFIGLELEGGERELALIWADYEGKDISRDMSISYPTTYSLKTDEQRIAEATALEAIKGAAPSKTYQKEVSKLVVKSVLDGKVNSTVITKIRSEIDAANYISGKAEDIASDFELGIVDPETAAEARGYDPALVEKAQEARIRRMAETAIAQTPGGGSGQAAARGGEGGGDPKLEKQLSQNADNNPNGGKAVRGKG